MAPLKQPPTLINICARVIVRTVNYACKTLGKKFQNREAVEYVNSVDCIQKYLLLHMPGHMLDKIYNEFSSARLDYDYRIYVSVFMHEQMREFKICPKFYPGSYQDSSFWTSTLQKLHNMVHLNLSRFCSVEILKVVGENCPILEYINIQYPNMSYASLVHLKPCKKLKVILLNEHHMHSEIPEGSVAVVGQLLKSLHFLEHISYYNMGDVLSDVQNEVSSLALKRLDLYNPSFSHSDLAFRLCSTLQDLCVRFRYSRLLNVPTFILYNIFFKSLSESILQLTFLELHNFHYCDPFLELLRLKGENLTTLILVTDIVTGYLFVQIGKYCKNLVHLDLGEFTEYMAFNEQSILYTVSKVYFSKLESLKLTVYRTTLNLTNILSPVLSQALQMKKLELFISIREHCMDTVLKRLLEMNPLMCLLSLHTNCELKMDTILRLFHSPNMKSLRFPKHAGITSDDIKNLRAEIAENNLDINLLVF